MRRWGDVVADVLVPPRPDTGTLRQRMLSRACEPLEVIDGELMYGPRISPRDGTHLLFEIDSDAIGSLGATSVRLREASALAVPSSALRREESKSGNLVPPCPITGFEDLVGGIT